MQKEGSRTQLSDKGAENTQEKAEKLSRELPHEVNLYES